MNQYEIAVLYHPDLEIDLTKATAKVEKIFTGSGAKITKTDNWGKRKLAYPIAKQEHAVYVFYIVDLDPQKVGEIDGILRITDEVIRYLITKIDPKAVAKAEKAKAKRDERIAKNPKADDASDEDEKK